MKSHWEWTLPAFFCAVTGKLFCVTYIMIFCFCHVFFCIFIVFLYCWCPFSIATAESWTIIVIPLENSACHHEFYHFLLRFHGAKLIRATCSECRVNTRLKSNFCIVQPRFFFQMIFHDVQVTNWENIFWNWLKIEEGRIPNLLWGKCLPGFSSFTSSTSHRMYQKYRRHQITAYHM